jgi:hypothetical protein
MVNLAARPAALRFYRSAFHQDVLFELNQDAVDGGETDLRPIPHVAFFEKSLNLKALRNPKPIL